MKFIVAFLLFPLSLFSQSGLPNPGAPRPRPVNDTLVTSDPSDKTREYLVIRNPNGTLVSQGGMHNGKRDGTWRDYGTKGMVLSIEEFKDGRREGAFVVLEVNGQVKVDATYRNDSLNGSKSTYQSGRLKMQEYYSNGILDGPRNMYYDDGHIQEESYFKNGKRDGLARWFLQSGKPSVEYTYVNGVLQGPAKEYDPSGNVKREGNYKNDSEEGEWTEQTDSVTSKKIIYKGGQVVKEMKIKK